MPPRNNPLAVRLYQLTFKNQNGAKIQNQIVTPKDYLAWSEPIYYFLTKYTETCPDSHKKNYQTVDWRNHESNFLKCTYHKRRYDSGCITLTLDNEHIVALSACYQFNNKIAYISSRACVLPGYEKFHLISSVHIPLQQEFFLHSHQFGITSFNTDEYSVRVMNSIMKRKKWSVQKALRLSGKSFIPFTFLEGKTFSIHDTMQYVAYCRFADALFDEKFLLEKEIVGSVTN